VAPITNGKPVNLGSLFSKEQQYETSSVSKHFVKISD